MVDFSHPQCVPPVNVAYVHGSQSIDLFIFGGGRSTLCACLR